MRDTSVRNANIDLRKLKFFVAVARAGSFVAASRDLHVSQPAVSYKILELERDLGVKLLKRHARGVALTPAGDSFLAHAEEILQRLQSAVQSLDRFREEIFGAFTFGLTPTCSRLLAHHLLTACLMEENIRISFVQGLSDELQSRLTSGLIDLALCYDFAPTANMRVTEVFREDVYLVGSPDVLRVTDDIRLADIADIPLVLDPRLHLLRKKIERAAAQHDVHLNVEMETADVTLKQSFMGSHRHCTLVHHGLYSDQIRQGQLIARRVVDPVIERVLVLAARPGVTQTVYRFFEERVSQIVAARLLEGEVRWRVSSPGDKC